MIGLSKKSQLTRNSPLKEKPLKDQQYLQWVHASNPSCYSCGKPYHPMVTELHHTKLYSSDKKNDYLVIPLCGETCHRNGDLSPHGNPKKWRETYPIEMQIEHAKKLYQEYLEEING